MKTFKKSKNPFFGKAFFDKEGNLLLDTSLKYIIGLDPKINSREYFYLLIEACKEVGIPPRAPYKLIKRWLGSSATQSRTKLALIKKGYL
jgi:hypothetical protein